MSLDFIVKASNPKPQYPNDTNDNNNNNNDDNNNNNNNDDNDNNNKFAGPWAKAC